MDPEPYAYVASGGCRDRATGTCGYGSGLFALVFYLQSNTLITMRTASWVMPGSTQTLKGYCCPSGLLIKSHPSQPTEVARDLGQVGESECLHSLLHWQILLQKLNDVWWLWIGNKSTKLFSWNLVSTARHLYSVPFLLIPETSWQDQFWSYWNINWHLSLFVVNSHLNFMLSENWEVFREQMPGVPILF